MLAAELLPGLLVQRAPAGQDSRTFPVSAQGETELCGVVCAYALFFGGILLLGLLVIR